MFQIYLLSRCSPSIFRNVTTQKLGYLNSLRLYRAHIYKEFKLKLVKFSKNHNELKLNSPIKISLGLGTCAVIKCSLIRSVNCEAVKTRLSGFKRIDETNIKFDWKKLWSYLLPQIWHLIAAIMAALAVAFLNIQIPQIMGTVINVVARFTEKGHGGAFIDEVKKPALHLITMYLAQSMFTFFYIYLLSGIGEKVAHKMKTDLFASILKQDIAFFDKTRTGELVNRLTSDIQDFKSSFKQIISGGLRNGAQLIGCGFSLFFISPQMTILTFLSIPSVIFIGSIFGALLRKLSKRAQAQTEKTTSVAEEAISNIRTVRSFAMEDQELSLYNVESELTCSLNQQLGLGIGLFQAGTNLFLNGMVLSTLYMGGYLLSTDQLSAGHLMAFLMATQTIQRSLAQLSLLFGSLVKGIAAGSRVFEYINMESSISLQGGYIIPHHSLFGNVAFENVTFSYPTRQHNVLNDFSLQIPAAKTVAIVGTSGSGKSTIVNLLERFYDVTKGRITIDGRDIRNLDPEWLRGRILGLIGQEPVLFATTIRENIRYGKPTAKDADVEKAAKQANADDFISKFPNGYDTVVGERGVTLSGGQKQRIAIARAILKDPRILILDEATSALDTESEQIVQNALENVRFGRTVLVIAHRLSTIQNADLIVVLHHGKIVEMGTHKSLIKLKGHYWTLVNQQMKSEKEEIKQ